jgi:hypothetical protein
LRGDQAIVGDRKQRSAVPRAKLHIDGIVQASLEACGFDTRGEKQPIVELELQQAVGPVSGFDPGVPNVDLLSRAPVSAVVVFDFTDSAGAQRVSIVS